MRGPRHWLRALWYRWQVARLAGPALLRALARHQPDAFFVQVGANDGQMMDPLRKQVLKSRWRGLLIEPVPQLFEQLSRNYAAAGSRVRPVNVAVAAQEGRLPFYHLRAHPDLPPLPSWAQGLGSFRRDVILSHRNRLPDLDRYLTEIAVPSLTWTGLCEHYEVERIDLLVTDTEGYDFEIIRQIDFTRWRPALIVYEHHHFTPQTRADCQALLHAQGYRLFEEGLDTWALHAEAGRDLMPTLERGVRRSRYAHEV